MSGFIEGSSRDQGTLFPERLDDLVAGDNPVRVIDAFVLALDLQALGFIRVQPKATGRPGYHPGVLLKLYLYGYLNRLRSSRGLERECQRNIELLWLLDRLAPDFKTIADFRRTNREAIGRVCRSLVLFLRGEGLIAGQCLAVDGSKFQADTSPQKAWTKSQLQKRIAGIDRQISDYLAEMDAVDHRESTAADRPSDGPDDKSGKTGDVHATLAKLRAQKANLTQSVLLMDGTGQTQVIVGDGDARIMRTGKGRIVGYNLQSAVDDAHGLIVHHDVTQATSDQNELHRVAKAAKDVLERTKIDVLADAGYADAQQIAACDADDITAFVPHPRSRNSHGEFFEKSDFDWDADRQHYICPAGNILSFENASRKNQSANYVANPKDCATCALKPRCTKADRRRVSRHLLEETLDKLAQRMADHPEAMGRRRSLVEHPFGILKHMMGTPRFLCRGLSAVKAEMALSVTAFNLKRAINILGTRNIIEKLSTTPA